MLCVKGHCRECVESCALDTGTVCEHRVVRNFTIPGFNQTPPKKILDFKLNRPQAHHTDTANLCV